jgi:hypothetical protein
MSQSEKIPLLPPDKLEDNPLNNSQTHKNALEKVSIKSVTFDLWAKGFIFLLFICYVIYQVWDVQHFINQQASSPLSQRLDPSIMITYIKYALGFNSALVLILGYWFGGNGGFSKLIHNIVSGIISTKQQ